MTERLAKQLEFILEIDAGDTYAYDTEMLKTQKIREDAAKERIYSLLLADQIIQENIHKGNLAQ